jgi:hypothetical protein
MTERGLPIVDGAPACPFVAFEDDRDERAASPDHRHRCFAEANPAPRALAHQEAYCLSSAFPVCPTFQDWARREAARSRAETSRDSDRVDPLTAPPTAQRNPPRNWAAPPPWAGRGGQAGEASDDDWEDDEEAAAGAPDVPRRGRGLSGSYADRVASDQPPGVPGLDPNDFDEDGDEDEDVASAGGAAAAGLTAGSMAGSAAGPAAGPTAGMFEPSRGPLAARRDPSEPTYRAAGWEGDEDADDAEAPPPPVRRRERDPERHAASARDPRDAREERGARSRRDDREGDHRSDRSADRGSDRRPERRRLSDAPEWERARPLEAYPTLRSRSLPSLSLPPLLVAVVALALAAAVLFALPGLLGFGNPSAGGSPTATVPTKTPIVTQAPTPVPEPTPQVYIVQPGDTMSKIAGRFDIPLADLIAANAENIPNPDALQIGDQVIIPAPPLPSELPAASEIPAAT